MAGQGFIFHSYLLLLLLLLVLLLLLLLICILSSDLRISFALSCYIFKECLFGSSQKKHYVGGNANQIPSSFLANGRLPRVSHQPRLSANDNADDEVKPRSVPDLLTIILRFRKTLKNLF